MKIPIKKQMSQFQNEAFQSDFVKCLVQTRRPSVDTATNLSFHFMYKLLHILENFIFFKINFDYLFSSYPYKSL